MSDLEKIVDVRNGFSDVDYLFLLWALESSHRIKKFLLKKVSPKKEIEKVETLLENIPEERLKSIQIKEVEYPGQILDPVIIDGIDKNLFDVLSKRFNLEEFERICKPEGLQYVSQDENILRSRLSSYFSKVSRVNGWLQDLSLTLGREIQMDEARDSAKLIWVEIIKSIGKNLWAKVVETSEAVSAAEEKVWPLSISYYEEEIRKTKDEIKVLKWRFQKSPQKEQIVISQEIALLQGKKESLEMAKEKLLEGGNQNG